MGGPAYCALVSACVRLTSFSICLRRWLPNSMIIDPADARCDSFYAACARLGMALLCHTGSETSVDFLGSRVDNQLGNPLRLRRALRAGVRVIAAHCASEGEARDDAGVLRPCHELLFDMMARAEWKQLLFADISALCSACGARTKPCAQSRHVPPMASSASRHERSLILACPPRPAVRPASPPLEYSHASVVGSLPAAARAHGAAGQARTLPTTRLWERLSGTRARRPHRRDAATAARTSAPWCLWGAARDPRAAGRGAV